MAMPTSRGVPSVGWVCRRRSGPAVTATMPPPSVSRERAMSEVMRSMPATSSPTTCAASRAMADVVRMDLGGAVDGDPVARGWPRDDRAIAGAVLSGEIRRRDDPRRLRLVPVIDAGDGAWRSLPRARGRLPFGHRHHLLAHHQEAVERVGGGTRDDYAVEECVPRDTRVGFPDLLHRWRARAWGRGPGGRSFGSPGRRESRGAWRPGWRPRRRAPRSGRKPAPPPRAAGAR